MPEFVNSTFFRNALGVVSIFLIWIIFSVFGLRGVTLKHTFKRIRQESGLTLLTFAIFIIAILGIIALFNTLPSSSIPAPI